MSKTLMVARVLNWVLLAVLLIAAVDFVYYGSLYGVCLALVTALIAVGVFKHNRWAYFTAAAWGLACFQLAKQGLEFVTVKRQAMMIGFAVIPLALFLHETLGRATKKAAPDDDTHGPSGCNMPE